MILRPLAALVAALVAPLCAADSPHSFWIGTGIVHRGLDEQHPIRGRLLTETGPMLQLNAGVQRMLPGGGAVSAEIAGLVGDLDYDGQTQSGVPLGTTTGHRDLRLDLAWRPMPPQDWGDAALVAGWHYNHRNIAPTATTTRLRETTTSGLVGLRWRSPFLEPSTQWQVRLEADALIGAGARVAVDFSGGYDDVRFPGGRQRRYALRVVGAPQSSFWAWTVEWSRLNQAPSASATLHRAGAPTADTARIPRLTSDDVSLRVTRRF